MRRIGKKYLIPQWNLRSDILSNCLHNLQSEKIIHRNNELLLISTYLRWLNVQEFSYSIIFFILVVRYFVRTHLSIFIFEDMIRKYHIIIKYKISFVML